MLKRYFMASVLVLASAVTMSAQFSAANGTTEINNFEFNDPGRRIGRLGIGGYDATLFPLPTSLFQVRADPNYNFNQISQVEQGNFGSFAAGNRWLGLGVGNPSGTVNPYGLAIVDNASLGFYNLIQEGANNNLVAGFGVNGNTNNNNFIIRSYFGVNGNTSNDILIASPTGSVGVNAAPAASLWVDAVQTTGNLAKAIAVRDRQPLSTIFGGPNSTFAASAIGAQANTSLANAGIAVEGFRAQIPDFATVIPNPFGVATNLQAVKNPYGGVNYPLLDFQTPGSPFEYAELTWQDLDFDDPASRDCNILSIQDAEQLDKFFISFRNSQSVDPFSTVNKLPVATFQANGRVGIGKTQPSSGVCGGREVLLDVNGWLIGNGLLTSSDLRFKQNIKPIDNSMDLIRKINGKTYNFNQDAFPDRNFGSGLHYGFIAQELEKVVPEATILNSDGYYYVDYVALVPILTEAIKEQDKTITDQAEQIASLETELQEIRNMVMDMKSADKAPTNGYRLEQNNPNPFGNETVVTYSLPAGTTGASINVYDLNGRLLKSYKLAETNGTVDISGSDLSSGIYLYDLLVNGRQMDVKRMVLNKLD